MPTEEKEYLFDDLDTEDDDVGDAEGLMDDAEEGLGEPSSGDYISECSEELAQMGIHVDPSLPPEEFLQTLCAALKTHRATKAQVEGEEEGFDEGMLPGETEELPQEEPQMVSMSVQRELARTQEELATERLEKMTDIIKKLIRNGQAKPETARKWLTVLGAKRMSLVKGDQDHSITSVLSEIKYAKQMPKGALWPSHEKTYRLSRLAGAEDMGDPETLYSSEKQDVAKQEEVSGVLSEMAGVPDEEPRRKRRRR